jgi:hypothetical protein
LLTTTAPMKPGTNFSIIIILWDEKDVNSPQPHSTATSPRHKFNRSHPPTQSAQLKLSPKQHTSSRLPPTFEQAAIQTQLHSTSTNTHRSLSEVKFPRSLWISMLRDSSLQSLQWERQGKGEAKEIKTTVKVNGSKGKRREPEEPEEPQRSVHSSSSPSIYSAVKIGMCWERCIRGGILGEVYSAFESW